MKNILLNTLNVLVAIVVLAVIGVVGAVCYPFKCEYNGGKKGDHRGIEY